MNPYYTDFSDYLRRRFPAEQGHKLQKISIDAGFSCPNRDGTLGHEGCIYCNPASFTPGYCRDHADVKAQLEQGKQFFARKYPSMRYLAYFQSFTNTHAPVAGLRQLWQAALDDADVAGLVVGTRPDCLPPDTVALLSEINRRKPVIVEIGAETSFDETLERINRHHTWRQVKDAVARCMEAGLDCGLHLICGLPGETPEMMLETARRAFRLPISLVKFHQLQVIAGTPLHRLWEAGELEPDKPMAIHRFTPESYMALCRQLIAMVPRSIAFDRFLSQSPPEMLVYPRWNLKNHEFQDRLLASLRTELT